MALRAGQTLRSFGVKSASLEAYFATHPEYAVVAQPSRSMPKPRNFERLPASVARPIAAAVNAFTPETTRYRKDRIDPRRECKICERECAAHGNVIKPGSTEQVRPLLKRNARIGSFTSAGRGGYIMSHKTFTRLRREDAEIDMLASRVIEGSRQRGQHLRWVRSRNQTLLKTDIAVRPPFNDLYYVRHAPRGSWSSERLLC
jgi:hypothetical protein